MRVAHAMEMNQIRSVCPAAFATHPHSSRSSQFVHIQTSDIIQKLMDSGFGVSRAQQKKTRSPDRMEATRHLIALRRRDIFNEARVGDIIPEVVLVNAHDGTTAYNLFMGMFRLACLNGMVTGKNFTHINVPHKGDVARGVLEGTFKLIEEVPALEAKVKSFISTPMSPEVREQFAERAMAIRYGDKRPFDSSLLLQVRRLDDAAENLWTVLNRIQENLMQGGQEGLSATGRRVTARSISRVTKDVTYNRELWDLAEEYNVH